MVSKRSKAINKHIDSLHEFKFQHKNELNYYVLRQNYLRYDYLVFLILSTNDLEICRKLQDNFKDKRKKPFNFYKVDMTCCRILTGGDRWDVIIRLRYKADASMLKLFSQVI